MDQKDKFWTSDIKILYNEGRYLKFIPTTEMTRAEQLNAITRFCVYFIILLLLTKQKIYIPVIIIIMTIIIYRIYQIDPTEPMGNVSKNGTVIETGYYNPDNQLVLGEYTNEINEPHRKKYSVDEIKEFHNGTCRKPTVDNPFMNPTLEDTLDENPPVGCNADDEDLPKDIKKCFDKNLYRDIDDLYDKQGSQREFYAVPNRTWPNDQDGFAKWLFKNSGTCKEHQEQCNRFEDLRNFYI